MIVIACNTVSATCLSDLRARHPGLPVLGIISPAARAVAESYTPENRIGVIGTKVTIRSEAYRTEILKSAPDLNIFETPCPIFVPLIEEGIIENEIMDLSIRRYLDGFIADENIDALVLGCTHYPLIKENIERLYPGLSIVDPSAEVVKSIEHSLTQCGMLAGGGGEGHVFYASDLSENFVNMISRIFDGSGFTVEFRSVNLETMA
jgi:glutamate racemase